MVTIKTKSVYDPIEPEDGTRILVMRFWPRGVSKQKLNAKYRFRDLAPSEGALLEYRRGMRSWEDFAALYAIEMSQPPARNLIYAIADGDFGETVTLLCWERGTERCHRFILKQLIEEAETHG